uniref:MANSC domain-containing protein n=1 Tax=Macrostomum lignano TaxID=282301 RepID=A0A1I8IIM5_9PLAT
MILFKAFLALLLTGFHVSLCEKCGPESFVIKKHSIIRTQDSIANGASAPHCIAIYDRCDGVVHCGDGSDEVDCTAASAASSSPAAVATAPGSAEQSKNYGSLQLSRAPVLAEDQLPNGPDSFLKNPAASRYGLDDATAAELLLRKSADDWGSSDKTGQRWLPASDRSLDYDQLANRLEPETIYNLDKADRAAAALEKSDAADADYYRLGAAAYADRDPDSAPPVSAYDAAPSYADWSSAESQRRRQRLKQLAASAAAATAAADPPWRPRSSGRAAEIGELDLP